MPNQDRYQPLWFTEPEQPTHGGLHGHSKSKYLTGLQCPRYLWIACNEPERIPEPDAATQHIFDQGHLVGEPAKKLFSDGIDLPTHDFSANIAMTRERLRQRRPLFECCMNLFHKLPFACEKALEWSRREEEYVKRAGFVLMAKFAVSEKTWTDDRFVPFLIRIKEEATDNRNYVKKAVNWALRQIGKRNAGLRDEAVRTAREIHAPGNRSTRWVASDALRELNSDAVARRLGREDSRAG